MRSSDHSGDPDTGISYNESSNAIQRLLDKLKKRPRQGGMMPVLGDRGDQLLVNRSIASLNSRLDGLIEFISNEDQPPKIQSWNPIKRRREHKALEQWVQDRPPSAGITAEDIAKKYPETKEERHSRVGSRIGAGLGIAAGAALGAAHPSASRIERLARGTVQAGTLGSLGAGAGAFLAAPKYHIKRAEKFERSLRKVQDEFEGDDAVPSASIKSSVPKARTYGEVAGELKKQDVGFLTRHRYALGTRPIAWGKNAAFLPEGEKGVIVTPKKVHPLIFRHEAGHAKDYAHYGGSQGFAKAYPHYGDPLISREKKISSTLLPEHRAWAYAKPRGKDEKKIQDAALYTYRYGMGLSELLDNVIEFANYTTRYPKPVMQTVWRKLKKGRFQGGTRSLTSNEIYPEFKKKKTFIPGRTELLASALDDLIQFQGDPRARNNLGMFTGNEEAGPDPNAMVKTYRVAPSQPGMAPNKEPGIRDAAGIALVGGALGAAGGQAGKHGYKALRKLFKQVGKQTSPIIRP